MKRLMGIMMAVGLAIGGAACDKKEATSTETKTEAKTPAGKTEAKTETKTETKPAEGAAKPAENAPAKPAEGAAAAPAGGDIGVAECDEYIKKMTECSTKMAPEAAGPMKESMETMKKAWKDASSTPEGKTALASGCKQALDAAKSAYASMGCNF